MEEEKKKEESSKKSPVGIVILVVVLMVLCIGGGYFASEKGIFKKDNSEKTNVKEVDDEEKNPIITNYEVDDEKVTDLIEHLLSIGSGRSCGPIETYAKDSKVEAKDLDNLTIYHIIENAEFYNNKDSFTLDEMNAAIKKYFYGDISFDPESINYRGVTCPRFNYDSNTKTFTKQATACGGACGPSSTYKLIKAVDTDGTLKLDLKVIFAKDENYYSDYQRTNQIGALSDISDSDAKSRLFDKGSDYQFTFKLVDGNYVFVSSELIK